MATRGTGVDPERSRVRAPPNQRVGVSRNDGSNIGARIKKGVHKLWISSPVYMQCPRPEHQRFPCAGRCVAGSAGHHRVLCCGARVSVTPEPSADQACSQLDVRREESIPPVSIHPFA